MIDLSHDPDVQQLLQEYEESLTKSLVPDYDREVELIQSLSEQDSDLYFGARDK